MRPSKSRFVTACQQLLALGAVLAVLAPAVEVLSLDVVTAPGEAAPGTAVAPGRPTLEARESVPTAEPAPTARVETAPVEPVVTEAPLDEPVEPVEPADEGADGIEDGSGDSAVQSAPEPVEGYGAVGVTWSAESDLEESDIAVRVRTRDGAGWSDWSELEYHDEHAPDPGTPEAEGSRPGTELLLVGEVDEVQAEAVTAEGVSVPADLSMAVIEPGESRGTEVEAPAIDTATLPADELPETSVPSSEGDLALQAGTVTSKPKIYSRAQWGANERMRSGSPSYYEVHAGFVHHTVNANNYSRSDVPGILRSIYAYHTQTRGWSDVGYNFLVDRFGRIWEGRAGGVGRPVVGAHTAGYNDYAFAMSAIGNFELVQPSAAMLDAYGKLMAWKLSLHGIDASDSSQRVGSRTFPAINGHRDAGSTACPGRYLYARLGQIRNLADGYQAGWSGRSRETDLVASGHPDLVVRRKSDQAAFVLPTGGFLRFTSGRGAGRGYDKYDTVVVSPDLTGDGEADLFVRNENGTAGTRPGTSGRGYATAIRATDAFRGLDQITAVGDLNGNGHNDLVARDPRTGTLHLFRGRGNGAFRRAELATGWNAYDLTIATGDLDGDGRDDLLTRSGDRLWLHAGTDSVRLKPAVAVNGRHWADWDTITGFGDYDGDGKADLFVRSRATKDSYVYGGRGNGRFRKHWLGPFGRVQKLGQLSGGQVLGSKQPDLVGVKDDRLVVVRHAGTKHTLARVSLGNALAGADQVLNVGDWDRDGRGDLLSRRDGQMRLHRGLGGGDFAAPAAIGGGWAGVRLLEAVGDVTGDGRPDLMGQPSGKAMRIYPGRGTKGFFKSYVARSSIGASRQLGIGLWDDDGSPDNAFRVGDRLVWYRGNGPGGLTGGSSSLVSPDLAPYDWLVSVGDVDGNGRQDLVARKGSQLWLLPGSRKGFKQPRFLAGGYRGYDLVG
ncbi:FG-GAP-like repeat-containing protein [Nocardioides donggukensis]|uniref:VCBS repeat-containing protein n=1 Tax=Nocardioides donggukensis TaxID=2774019 RepID=A0A927Q0R2_9ACTN|nr:FG-GAP-like repeat-containing protein [Nocardioides donggukensis]MBD8868724.1 VCBS repeat-containing protein [Nocardioides donggukensis]